MIKYGEVKLESTAVYSIRDARKSDPVFNGTRALNEFLSMTLGERAYIARHIVKTFNPTSADEPSEEFKTKYNRDWWVEKIQYVNGKGVKVNGDVAHFVLNACLFPERSQDEWSLPKVTPEDFYVNITRETALGWYEGCPNHLRKPIVERLATMPSAKESLPSDAIYQKVKEHWGDRPVLRYSDEPGFGVELVSHYIEQELYFQWRYEYEKEALIRVVVELGPGIQQERKTLNEAMGLNVDEKGLPSQAEGLDPVTAATVRWIQMSGETPLEVLARTMRDPEIKPAERIAAAAKLMDYVHRRVPVKQELKTEDVTDPKLDPKALRGLNEEELKVLEKLLTKLSKDA